MGAEERTEEDVEDDPSDEEEDGEDLSEEEQGLVRRYDTNEGVQGRMLT
jgi:hypothetical protein